MKEIGNGWQYIVYNLDNKRVIKKHRSDVDQYFRVFLRRSSKFRFNPIGSIIEAKRIKKLSTHYIFTLKEILHLIPGDLLGNPKFGKGLNYEQDLVLPITDHFQGKSTKEKKEIIRKYIDLLLELWRYGCSDSVYNYHVNCGINDCGQVMLLDIGELVSQKELIVAEISSQKWLGQMGYNFAKANGIEEFYADEMAKTLTLENLEKNWKYKISQ